MYAWRQRLENKSIGKFISTLRKASGMTQKDLGDKLFVSDKTISRWEREDSAPEISLLPAIAEVFGITVDELLHGERNIIDVEDKVETTETKEEIKSQNKSKTSAVNKPLLIKLLAIFGCIVILLSVGLAIVNNVEFTTNERYNTFADLKQTLETDYDQWLEANYSAVDLELNDINKEYKVQETIYIPNATQGEQYVGYYYHKEHYRKVYIVSENKTYEYIAVRVGSDVVKSVNTALWTILGISLVLPVVLYFVLANKKKPTTEPNPEN